MDSTELGQAAHYLHAPEGLAHSRTLGPSRPITEGKDSENFSGLGIPIRRGIPSLIERTGGNPEAAKPSSSLDLERL